MRIVAVANQKGGCGKTTIVINLAACLAREGQRTLAVDLDPQGHCALGLLVPEDQIESSVADLLMSTDGSPPADLGWTTWQISSNFDLIPSKTELARLEQKLAGVEGREHRLRTALQAVSNRYDFVLLDTPPTIGLFTQSALHAADEVIVPVDTGYFSLHGLSKQLDTIREIRAESGRSLTVRILANLYDVRTKLGREILAELRKRHGDAMFNSYINFNTKLKESTSLGQPITEYDPNSSGCKDFVRLARELIGLEPAAATANRYDEAVPSDVELLARADALAADADRLLATSETLIGSSRPSRAQRPAPMTPEETDRKIALIYGAIPTESGVSFLVRASGARDVRLAGDFNDWNPMRTPLMPISDGTFGISLPLGSGRYRYRYVVDGRWITDPANHRAEVNPYGEYNSVVEVAR